MKHLSVVREGEEYSMTLKWFMIGKITQHSWHSGCAPARPSKCNGSVPNPDKALMDSCDDSTLGA